MEESDDPETSVFSAGEDSVSNVKLESDASTLSDVESDSSDFKCLEEARGGDENAMGKTAGDAYTMADNRAIAKYIATFDGTWSVLTAKERWAQFCERVSWSLTHNLNGCSGSNIQHPQREYSSWQKRYKRDSAGEQDFSTPFHKVLRTG
jgi:hypothetical protein